MPRYLLLIVPKRPQLNPNQFRAVVDMAVGGGLISLGSILVPGLFDKASAMTVIYGLAGVIVFWITAIWVAGKIR